MRKIVFIFVAFLLVFVACEKDPIILPDPGQKPVVSFTIPDTLILDTLSSEVILSPNNLSTGATSYLWTINDKSSNLPKPDFLLDSVGEFSLKLVASNSVGSSEMTQSLFVKKSDCRFDVKITCASNIDIFEFGVYFSEEMKYYVQDKELTFFLSSNYYGTVIDDMKIEVHTTLYPGGHWYCVPSFTVCYNNKITIYAN